MASPTTAELLNKEIQEITARTGALHRPVPTGESDEDRQQGHGADYKSRSLHDLPRIADGSENRFRGHPASHRRHRRVDPSNIFKEEN